MSESNKKICNICCFDYNRSTRKGHSCPSCGFGTCRTCIRTYLLSRNDDPHCLKCKNRWELDTLILAAGRTWVNKDYKEHKKKILFEHEKSRLPATMPAVENYKVCKVLEQKYSSMQDQLNELRRMTHQLRQQQQLVTSELYTRRRGVVPKEKRKFMKACPADGCRGFLSTQWKCALCQTQVCSKCFAIKPLNDEGEVMEHECKDNDLKSAETIRKETRNCPSCAAPVYKTEGCDQMWCTQCHTAFSWRTGLKVTGVIHNPHFYAWQNNGGGAPRANAPGAVMCGGVPQLYTYRNALRSALGTTPWGARHRDVPLSPAEKINVKAVELHRACTHFAHVELDRVRRICNGAQDNEELRIKYILKDIDGEALAREVLRRDKKRNKAQAMLQIYELINTVFTESIRDIMGGLQANDSDETPTEIIERNIQRCHALRDYANDELMKISVMYSQTVAYIEDDFSTSSRKYRTADLKATA